MNTGSMSVKTACDVAVIGGGAAGMMAALQAAWAGARVALLEKNEKLGKKIYITGKGHCNVTNVADIDDFFKQIPRNPRFLSEKSSGAWLLSSIISGPLTPKCVKSISPSSL